MTVRTRRVRHSLTVAGHSCARLELAMLRHMQSCAAVRAREEVPSV